MEEHRESPELSDEEVLSLSLESPSIFSVLVDRYEEAFLRKARSILKSEEDARDVVQETFVRIYIAGKRFKKVEGASFSSWGYKILLRQCFTLYQKKKKTWARETALDEELLAVIPDKEFSEMHEKFLLREEMLSFVSKLPESLRVVVRKFFFEEKSHKEIAQEEGFEEGVSRIRLHRAKQMLKKLIK